MKTINELIMDSLEDRIKELTAAAKALVEQVENYTMKAGSRTMLLLAKEKLKTVLRE
jgi:hypothetical protein